jgi:hypothetical protein
VHHRPCAARVQADTLARVVDVAAGIRRAARAWAGLPAPPALRSRPPERSSSLSSRTSTMHADAHAAAPPAPAAAAPAKPPAPTTPALKGPIFRAAPASPLQVLADGVASGGALEAAEQRVPVFLKALGAGPALERTKALEDKIVKQIQAALAAVAQCVRTAPRARPELVGAPAPRARRGGVPLAARHRRVHRARRAPSLFVRGGC